MRTFSFASTSRKPKGEVLPEGEAASVMTGGLALRRGRVIRPRGRSGTRSVDRLRPGQAEVLHDAAHQAVATARRLLQTGAVENLDPAAAAPDQVLALQLRADLGHRGPTH